MSLRKKVFLGFFIFIIIPLFFVSLAAYWISQNIIEQKYNEQSKLTIRAVQRNISSLFKEVNTYSEYWRFEEKLNTIFQQTSDELRFTTAYNNSLKLLDQTFLTFDPVDQVVIYTLNGDVISSNKISSYRTLRIPYYELIRHPIFEQMVEQRGSPIWFGPYEYPELTDNGKDFTTLRMLRDPSTMDIKGYLILQLRLSELVKVFNSFLTNESFENRFMIVNHQGIILFDTMDEIAGKNLFSYTSDQFDLTQDYASIKTKFMDDESIVTVHDFNLAREGILNWSLISVKPWDYLSGETLSVLKGVVAVTLFFLISALLFNLFFVNHNIRFILGIVSMMKHVELGNLNIRVPVKGKDETTVLARGFNSLVHRIATLLDEVKTEQQRKNKAELMLLEAQIKPHFIFNTLESINALAIQNEGKKVSQLVYRLGSMLRMFEHQEEIPLAMEMDYLRNYLEIQSYRFENLFTYEIDLPDALKKYFILKLTLQPLVENSIQHGFEGIESGGVISIKVEEHKEQLILWIQDNGCGIPEHVLRRLQYKTSQMNLRRKTVNGERLGLGITNVADRLRIHYGPEYGIMICSDQTGTTIKCAIPKYIPPGDEVGLESVAR